MCFCAPFVLRGVLELLLSLGKKEAKRGKKTLPLFTFRRSSIQRETSKRERKKVSLSLSLSKQQHQRAETFPRRDDEEEEEEVFFFETTPIYSWWVVCARRERGTSPKRAKRERGNQSSSLGGERRRVAVSKTKNPRQQRGALIKAICASKHIEIDPRSRPALTT